MGATDRIMSRVFLDLEQVDQHLNALLPGKRSVVKGDGHRHKFPSTWVHMAIIAMNSASEASAAASWIIALKIKSTVSMIALQRNSPSPSQVPYQIDLEGQRFRGSF